MVLLNALSKMEVKTYGYFTWFAPWVSCEKSGIEGTLVVVSYEKLHACQGSMEKLQKLIVELVMVAEKMVKMTPGKGSQSNRGRRI